MSARPAFVLIAFLTAAAPALAQMSPSPGLPAQPPASLDPSATAPRPGQRPDLNAEQRAKIHATVLADKTKAARTQVPTEVGADVPPATELHSLPADAMIAAPITKMYKCVVVDAKVVLVDPTTMRVVEVIER